MEVTYNSASSIDQLLDPQASAWQQIKASSISLEGTPAAMQPTAAIRETWSDKTIGSVSNVSVQAIHNGKELAFRLEWDAPNHKVDHGDNSIFPDGAAIAFPVVENAPVMMGAPKMPINIWFWRANENGNGRQIDAQGIGTSDTINQGVVKSNGSWNNGKWSVVIARAMQVQSEEPAAQLQPGDEAKFSVAIWDGSNQERGGIKSYSGLAWLDLTLAGGK